MSENKSPYMTREQILECITQLSKSQGSYSRILKRIHFLRDNHPEEYESSMKVLENQHFADSVDLVLFFES